jgi:hypothetical protein
MSFVFIRLFAPAYSAYFNAHPSAPFGFQPSANDAIDTGLFLSEISASK